MSEKEKDLSNEELEQASGGRRTKRANQPMANTSGEIPEEEPATGTGGVSIGGVEPLPDPPFQS